MSAPQLVCGVCGCVMKNPVTLEGCGHCVCKGCAQNLFDNSLMVMRAVSVPPIQNPTANSASGPSKVVPNNDSSDQYDVCVSCSDCGAVTRIRADAGVDGALKPNHSLSQFCDKALETATIPTRQNQQSLSCEECNQKQATVDCVNCVASFCDTCLASTHASSVLKRHVQGKVGSTKLKTTDKCVEHGCELNGFCLQDQQLVCLECTVNGNKHQGHNYVGLREAGQSLSADLEQARQAIEKLRATLESRVGQLHSNSATLARDALQVKTQVESIFIELKGAVDRYKQCILNTIDSCVRIAAMQHQGVVNLIQQANTSTADITAAQTSGDTVSTRDKLSVKQRANKLHKVLENVNLDQPIPTNNNNSAMVRFTLDVDAVLTALHQGSCLECPYYSSTAGSVILGRDSTLQDNMTKVFQVHSSLNGNTGTLSRLELLFQGSRDGFSAQEFHSKCDGDKMTSTTTTRTRMGGGSTLTIIRDSNGNVFGGYSTAPWSSHSGRAVSQASNEVFIFSLKGPMNGTTPAMFTPTDNPCQHATYDYASWGPLFGGGFDFGVHNNMQSQENYSNLGHTYKQCVQHASLANVTINNTTLAGSYNFTISEIEVFLCG